MVLLEGWVLWLFDKGGVDFLGRGFDRKRKSEKSALSKVLEKTQRS